MGLGGIAAAVGATAAVGNTVANLTSGHQQAKADTTAANQQLAMYNQTRSDLSPFFTGGQGAFSQLANLFGVGTGAPNTAAMSSALSNWPGYQWTLQQGNQALDRSAAARGLLLSGGQLKDLTDYNQGQATSVFGNYLSGLSGLSNLGENAAAMTGNAGSAAANAFGNYTSQAGGANAAGTAGAANSLFGNNGVLQNALQAYTAMNNGGSTNVNTNNYIPLVNPSDYGINPTIGGGSGDYSNFFMG